VEVTDPAETSRGPRGEHRPKILGLLGGVASGKSAVATHLARLGAGILDADRAAHEVLTWPEVLQDIRQRWGDRAIGNDGTVDRKALAAIVFAPPPAGQVERDALEQITHPRIGQYMAQQMQALLTANVPAIVVDAPLLLRAGWDKSCDRLIYVDAPREVRLARAQTRGWSEEDFSAREAAQESLDAKRAMADVVIDNSGSQQETFRQIEEFWRTEIG
jgi:dephospho-CoA kinase